MRLVRDIGNVLQTEANWKLKDKLRQYLLEREITDTDLLKMFGICLPLSEDRNAESIPRVFDLGLDIKTLDFDSINDAFLFPYKSDPRVFIRFATPMFVKNLDYFYEVCRKTDFPIIECPEVLVAVAICLHDSLDMTEEDAFTYVSDLLGEFDSDIAITPFVFHELRMSMSTFRYTGQNPDDEKDADAYRALRVLNHDLHQNFSKRLQSSIDFYKGVARTGDEALSQNKAHDGVTQFTEYEPARGDIEGNRRKDSVVRLKWNESRMYLNKTDPINLLMAEYRLKSEKGNVEKKTSITSSYRNTDDGVSCGIIYDVFTGMIDKTDPKMGAVICFPSPGFIKSVYEDRDLKNTREILFLVESDEEKELLDIQFGKVRTKKKSNSNNYDERTNLKVSTLYDFIKNVRNETQEIPYQLALVFSSGMEVNEKVGLKDLGSLFNDYPRINQILCFGDDGAFYRDDSFVSTITREDTYDVDSLLFFPTSLPYTAAPKKKSLLFATRKDESSDWQRYFDWYELSFSDNRLTLDSDSCVTNCEIHYLSRPKNKNIRSTLEGKKTIKDEEQSVQKPLNNRDKAEAVDFTENEITIHYTYREKDYGKYFVHAYVKCGEPARMVKDSYGSAEIVGSPNDVRNWALNEYPYKTKLVEPENAEDLRRQGLPVKKVEVGLRPIIANAYKEELLERDVCLKTLTYIHPDLEEKYDDESKWLAVFLIKEFGNVKVSQFDSDTFVDRLSKLGLYETEITKALVLLNPYFECAQEDGQISDNVIKDVLADDNRNKRLFSNIRSNLSVKSLTVSQMRSIYKYIDKHIKKGDSMYVGVLIKLLTGLETNAVCALRWSDFCEVKDYDYCQLHVYKKVSSGGKGLEIFKATEDFRCIPCSEILSKKLQEYREKLRVEGRYNDEDYIITAVESEFPPDPSNLGKATKDAIDYLQIKGLKMAINEDVTTDFSKYLGDMMRENFRYNAQVIGKMTASEVAFFLGNKAEDTFSTNYCDYSRDSSQLILQAKLRRIDAELVGEMVNRTQEVQSRVIGCSWVDFPPVENGITKVDITAISDSEEDYSVEFKSDYGVYSKKVEEAQL